MHSNINGLIEKELELYGYIEENKPEVIRLAETKLDKDVDAKVWGSISY